MKIGITADSSSGLEYAPFKHDIRITKTRIQFGDENLIDGVDIKANEFYERLEQTDIVPTTSAPEIRELNNRIVELQAEGCTDIIHFAISFNLSSYGGNWQMMSKELFEGINLYVFDSNTACIMEGYNAHYAEILANKGYSVPDIIEQCSKFRKNTNAMFVVDDLKYLVKNGRLSGAAGFIGNLAKIKPILELNREGRIVTFEKVRTHQKAIQRMIDLTIERCSDAKRVLYIVQHANRLDKALEIAKYLEQNTNNAAKIEVSMITPTVGAHIGSGLLGIGRIILDDLAEDICK